MAKSRLDETIRQLAGATQKTKSNGSSKVEAARTALGDPNCPHCGGIARPGVVWFGEAIDPGILNASREALNCDVCLVVGTSSVVYPAAGLSAEARRRGAFTAEINTEATEASPLADLSIGLRAEVALPEIDRLLPPREARPGPLRHEPIG